jgi:hypothetical protein
MTKCSHCGRLEGVHDGLCGMCNRLKDNEELFNLIPGHAWLAEACYNAGIAAGKEELSK